MLEFLLDLDEKLERKKGDGYLEFRKKNILILDNAAYHKTGLIKWFSTKRGIQMITMPQYMTEWNLIEIVWGWVKVNLSKMNMNSR